MTMKSAPNMDILSFHIIDRLSKDDTMISWSFPTLHDPQRRLICSKVFSFKEQSGVYYLRSREWVYIKEFHFSSKQSAICVFATDYNYSKYELLCNILVDKYINTGSPIELTKIYLSFSTMSTFQENGTIFITEFKRMSSVSTCILKDMIKSFGPKIILVYTALLFKQRVIVYHSNFKLLQKGLLCICKLMPYRNPNDFLYPIIDDISIVQGKTVFVAGILIESLRLTPGYYDLFINLIDSKVTVMPQAKDTFTMSEIQRDLATFLMEMVEKTDINDTQIETEIKTKTQDLLDYLNTFTTVTVRDRHLITMDSLRERKLNPKTENFLFNLAIAENIMML